MFELPALTPGQWSLVYNGFSLAIAAMGASFIFFLAARSQVAEKYRPALLISALIVAIAAYHYFRIFESWGSAFIMNAEGMYVPSGESFNDAYRYVDWLLTVPLLLVEAIAVLALTRGAGSMIFRLTVASVLMIALGYPGEIATDNGTRALWGTLSTLPFIYILWVLWAELGKIMPTQPQKVRVLVRNLRLLLIATWGVYPIAYMMPFFGTEGATAVVGIQVGYTIADIAAKAGYGLLIYAIARAKTLADAEAGVGVGTPAMAGAGD